MSKKQYICVRPWARHSKGEIIDQWEYSKLPHEIKVHCNFEEYNPGLADQVVTDFGQPPIPTEEDIVITDIDFGLPTTDNAVTYDINITSDLLHDAIEGKKRKK